MPEIKQPANQETGEVEGPRAFNAFFANIVEGEAEGEASYQLHELVKAMQKESKARGDKVSGSLSIKLKFVVDTSGHVFVGYKVTKSEPDRKTSAAVFWMTEGGNLTPDNPKQQKLALREVPGGKAKTRDITEPKSAVNESAE